MKIITKKECINFDNIVLFNIYANKVKEQLQFFYTVNAEEQPYTIKVKDMIKTFKYIIRCEELGHSICDISDYVKYD